MAEFLEQLLQLELDARMLRTREALLKLAGLPAIKHFADYMISALQPAHRANNCKN